MLYVNLLIRRAPSHILVLHTVHLFINLYTWFIINIYSYIYLFIFQSIYLSIFFILYVYLSIYIYNISIYEEISTTIFRFICKMFHAFVIYVFIKLPTNLFILSHPPYLYMYIVTCTCVNILLHLVLIWLFTYYYIL